MRLIILLLVLLYHLPLLSSSVEQCFIQNPHEPSQLIEYFIMKPEGNGPFPVFFLLHGHQPLENSEGGEQFVSLHYLERFVNMGVVAISISTPGFGRSGGLRDFSGPASQKAIAAVIEHVKNLPFADPQKMGIYGVSKGAILASMVHKYTSALSLQILEGGMYDLAATMPLMPDYLASIEQNILAETGGTIEALEERSALYNTEYIHGKTVILLGEFDDRRPQPSSIALHEKLISEGKESLIKIFPNELHVLLPSKWETIIPLVRTSFFDLHGIGIQITMIPPALQIAKIHQGSPADRIKKLRVGDIILRISPNNDQHEIDTLRMPIPQFISLTLGKKGAPLRLHVQHFDTTYEAIVIERDSH